MCLNKEGRFYFPLSFDILCVFFYIFAFILTETDINAHKHTHIHIFTVYIPYSFRKPWRVFIFLFSRRKKITHIIVEFLTEFVRFSQSQMQHNGKNWNYFVAYKRVLTVANWTSRRKDTRCSLLYFKKENKKFRFKQNYFIKIKTNIEIKRKYKNLMKTTRKYK